MAVALPIREAVQVVQAGMTAAQAQGEMQWSKYCKCIPESVKFLSVRCTELHLVLLCLTGKALPSDELARLCNSLATSAMDTDAASDVAHLLQDCRDTRQACVSSSYMWSSSCT
jgi:hypothetical protein